MSDFNSQNAIPFAFGSLTGIRCWRVQDGVLNAINHPHRYQPGENLAGCAAGMPDRDVDIMYRGRLQKISHHPGVHWCSCGFYAYYGGDNWTANAYAGPNTVVGLVQGYGRCSYGANGFRAEKLKILAIINPFLSDKEVHDQVKRDRHRNSDLHATKISRRQRLSQWYFHGWKSYVLPILCFLTWIMAVSTIGQIPQTLTQQIGQALIGFAALGAGILTFRTTIRKKAFRMVTDSLGRIDSTPEIITPGNTNLTRKTYQQVRGRYPDVPHYRSVEEALKIFPLTDYYQDTPGGKKRRV